MNTKRKELLGSIKGNTTEAMYNLILRVIDMDNKEMDRLSELNRKAELNCLKKHNFDTPDYLEPKDLVEFMELENAELVKFKLQPEWDLGFIESVRTKIPTGGSEMIYYA